jgi:phage shock protein C
MAVKRLTRSKEKMWAGVLAGIGVYLDVDPTIVRVVYAFLTVLTVGFPGLLAYIIMWIIIPKEQSV